jgi:SAM-dependent methyltransferase
MSAQWFELWFDENYDLLYGNRNLAQAKIQVQRLLQNLKLSPGDYALDIGCGAGRHLTAMLDEGLCAWGVDLSSYLLQKSTLGNQLLRADMRYLPFRAGKFKLITSFFSSFGYFETEEENLAMLRDWKVLLQQDGYLFLDLMNPDYLCTNLPPDDEKILEDGTWVKQVRSWNGAQVTKTITLQKPNQAAQVFLEKVRVFTLAEIQDVLFKSGLRCIGCFGDELLNSYQQTSPRIATLWQN